MFRNEIGSIGNFPDSIFKHLVRKERHDLCGFYRPLQVIEQRRRDHLLGGLIDPFPLNELKDLIRGIASRRLHEEIPELKKRIRIRDCKSANEESGDQTYTGEATKLFHSNVLRELLTAV